jgi:hypothetical protein
MYHVWPHGTPAVEASVGFMPLDWTVTIMGPGSEGLPIMWHCSGPCCGLVVVFVE